MWTISEEDNCISIFFLEYTLFFIDDTVET